MRTNSSISLALLLLSWTAAGLCSCEPDADVQPPDVDRCPAQHYRVRGVEIPITARDALAVAFDLDGDGVRDNWLGFASTVLHAWSPAFDVAPVVENRLADDLEWSLVVQQCAPGGPATAALATRMIDLDGLEPARGDRAPAGTPLAGGTVAIPLGALADTLGTAPPGWVAAPLAQVRIDTLDPVTVTATIDVAVRQVDVRSIVAPALAAYFTVELAAGDSEFAAEADRDDDGIVTADELMASDTARILLAPDLDPSPELAGDGLSLGFRISGRR